MCSVFNVLYSFMNNIYDVNLKRHIGLQNSAGSSVFYYYHTRTSDCYRNACHLLDCFCRISNKVIKGISAIQWSGHPMQFKAVKVAKHMVVHNISLRESTPPLILTKSQIEPFLLVRCQSDLPIYEVIHEVSIGVHMYDLA